MYFWNEESFVDGAPSIRHNAFSRRKSSFAKCEMNLLITLDAENSFHVNHMSVCLKNNIPKITEVFDIHFTQIIQMRDVMT